MSSAPAHPPDRLARLIVASVGWTARHPWAVLLGCLVPLSWQMLSSQTLLAKGAAALEARAAGREPTPADRDLIAQLPAVIRSAAATLRDPAGYRNPWAVGGPATADRDAERQLTEPQYFFTPDGTLAMLVCRPRKAGQSFTPAKAAAVTTALAFFATMLADFKAVAELGWIAGWGVLFCAASCLTLMPAALAIVERVRERRNRGEPQAQARGSASDNPVACAPGSPAILPFPAPPAAWMPGLAGRPRAVLAVGVVLLVGCGAFAGRLSYDHNLLNLQPRGLDSVAWEHKLIDRAAGATWDALSIAHTREE